MTPATSPPRADASLVTGRTHACFSETGYCAAGAFLATWEKMGGITSLGYPISPRRLERSESGDILDVQWFERGRLEDHDGVVMLTRLGVTAFAREHEGKGWEPGKEEGERPDCRFFPETKHFVCGELLGALDRLGVARVGLPIAEEENGTQWFERMQLHVQDSVPDRESPWRVVGAPLGRREMAASSDMTHEPARPFRGLAGWAYSVRVDVDRAAIARDMKRMKSAGANVVYLSHANPGEVAPDSEPGMTFAVWDAIERGTDEKTKAEAQLARIKDAIELAEAEGLSIVLAVGYQMELGSAWSDAHDADLRRDADGTPMLTWTDLHAGRTGSPYSKTVRADLERYWRWVDATLVRPHPKVVALNIGDEPMGADWSPSAKAEFARVYGRPFDDAPAEAQGHFLSGVLADWASWSAGAWLRINPDVHTLMTFHIQRDVPWFPDFERIFAEAPRSFIVSADTHLHDAPPEIAPLDPSLLANQARTLGWLSRVYGKTLMLWSSANDWGLGCDRALESCKFGVEDAVKNVDLVTDLPREVGGDVGMVMAFGYNQKYLGAFGPAPNPRVYDPTDLFTRVSAALLSARGRFAARGDRIPEGLVLRREALETYVATRLPELQRERRGGAHVTEPIVSLGDFRDMLGDRGVVLVAGRASGDITAAQGRVNIVR